MRKFLIGCALVAGMGAMLPSASLAQDVQIEIGRDGLRLREACDSRYENCRDDRRGRDYARRFCTEDRALNKAERMGVRRARIVSAGRRSIEVRGRDRRGDRVQIRFGREPNCPVYR